MAKQVDNTNIGTLLEALITKIKSFFWQKDETSELPIDNTPTSGSDNLVKSGGVYTALQGKYTKPSGGIPASDLASGVIPDVSQFITRSVNDLVNYYLKSEVYTKDEVASLIGAIQQFHYEIAASTSAVTDPSNNVLYLIGPTGSGADKYEEYVYDATKPVAERWVKIGDTTIDLSNYVTLDALNDALADTVAGLATVARSGSYNDLLNKPDIPADKVFVAEFGVTPYADVLSAVNDNSKVVFCQYLGVMYPYISKDDDGTIRFGMVVEKQDRYLGVAEYRSYIFWVDTGFGWNFAMGMRKPFLDTTSETTLPTKASESLMETVKLHKVSKTGNYNDLLNKPTIPTEVFVVTYGTTTQDEILAAVAAGQLPVCKYGNNLYVYAGESSADYSQFTSVLYDTAYRIYVKNSTWGNGSYGVYSKPSGGIPASDIAAGVIPDVSQFITKSVNDLVNYYKKTEAYNKTEVDNLIGAIQGFHYEIAASTSAVTNPQSNVLYLIGPTGTGSDKYEEYVYTTEWVKIGDTSIDLSGYVTTQALNTALAGYVTSGALETALAGKQDKIDANHKLDYSLVSNTPTIPAAQVPSDWNATEGVSRILNKPTIPTQYAGSPTAGGFANKAVAIPFGNVDVDSTATDIKATVDNFPTTLTDGVCAYIRNDVVGSASGFTLNINGTGAKPVYQTMADASRSTTVFAATTTYLFVYNSSRVEGGCWDIYYGYNSNDNTIGYILRTNSTRLRMKSVTYRYRLLFTSADGQHWVPANNSTSTSATAKKTVCQDKIDPFGRIVYYGTTSSVAANSLPAAAYMFDQQSVTLGYSFNRTGAALVLTTWSPVYVKATPQTDGSVIIDPDTPYVQELPSTADGDVYIFLGVAVSETQIELHQNHPVYYHDGTRVTNWPGPVIGDIQTALDAIIGKSSISFTIEGTTYQADAGMTWGEWAESAYNTVGYLVRYDAMTQREYVVKTGNAIKYNNEFVLPTDIIQNGGQYSTGAKIIVDDDE